MQEKQYIETPGLKCLCKNLEKKQGVQPKESEKE